MSAPSSGGSEQREFRKSGWPSVKPSRPGHGTNHPWTTGWIALFLTLTLSVGLCGCGVSEAAGTAQGAKNSPPTREVAMVMVNSGGIDRMCKVIRPAETGRMPLVILIHCSTDTPDSAIQKSGFDALAKKQGFILAAPEVAGPKKGWSSHPAIFGKTGPPADDIQYFHDLIDTLQMTYPVDASRVYVAGQLSGGMMAYRLASEMPDRIAAIGVVNATIGVTATKSGLKSKIPKPSRPVPIIAFHGWSNKVMPYDGGNGARGARSYVSVNQSIDFWRASNGCVAEPQIKRYGKRETVRILYPSKNGLGDVLLYKLPHADHEWPKMVLDVGGVSHTPAALMWAFFEAHRRAR